jgi:HlyD family secretion protein
VTIDSIPDQRFKARVTKVAVLPNSQDRWMNPNLKVYSTDVLIEDELPDLKPGASARAEIIVTNLVAALTVPLQSVTTVKGKQVCFVQQDGELVPVPITVGNFNDQFIEVRSGLKEGDEVALTPPPTASEDLDLGGSVLSAESKPTPPAKPAADPKKSLTQNSRL